jgi:hypothetical protein
MTQEVTVTNPRPKARRDGLIIQELPTELLVYDQKSHRAHCLNAAAASVFRNADGSRSVAEIARAASERLGAPFGEDLAWLALHELDRNALLETPLPLVPRGAARRDVLRGGAVAAMLPVILAITAPTPASAQSGGVTGPTGATGPAPPASTGA